MKDLAEFDISKSELNQFPLPFSVFGKNPSLSASFTDAIKSSLKTKNFGVNY